MSLGPVRLQPEGRGLGLELWREAAASRDGGTGRKARAFSSSRLISQAEGSTGKPTEVYRGLNLVLSVKGREEPGPCGEEGDAPPAEEPNLSESPDISRALPSLSFQAFVCVSAHSCT